MEEILEEVKTYDLTVLRSKLKDLVGINIGPIAPSTKLLFQKRLASHLFRAQGGKTEEEEEEHVQPVTVETKVAVEPEKKKVPSNSDLYYAVCLPEDVLTTDNGDQLVFSEKEEALKTAKKFKGSRFKSFKSEKDAWNFSKLRAESAFQSPKPVPKEDVNGKESKPAAESSPFKAPKPQDLAKLRKVIEMGDARVFQDHVWNNPRYLVGSGDTPAIYKEGPRYTAMHIAALKDQPEMCQTILDILENPKFVNKLYSLSHNTVETQNSRINFLVDLYLNMPDKGGCESPLHMACKFGLEKVVEVLVAHPKTDRFLKNKWGDTPKNIICTRCPKAASSLKQKIETLMEGQCYVPLMRCEDNCMPPLVGQPWSADVNKSPLDVPQKSWSPRDPSLSIKACAGPMSPSEADRFHKRWTTPPSQSPDQARAYFHTKRSDSEKGLERIGRRLAHEMRVTWSEYWEFLGTFADLSTPAGLEILEEYFRKRIWMTFLRQFKEKYIFTEPVSDFSGCMTPVKHKSARLDSTLSDSVFDKDEQGGNKDCNADAGSQKKEVVNAEEGNETCDAVNVSDVVSPMTGLAMGFEKLHLKDDSLLENATTDTSLLSSCDEVNVKTVPGDDEVSKDSPANDSRLDDGKCDSGDTGVKNGSETLDVIKDKSSTDCASNEDKRNSEGDNLDKTDECKSTETLTAVIKNKSGTTDEVKSSDTDKDINKKVNDAQSKASERESECDSDIFKDCENNNIKDGDDVIVTESCKVDGDRAVNSLDETTENVKRPYFRSLSDSSESVTSFVTAAEDVNDPEQDVEDKDDFIVSLHTTAEIFNCLTDKVANSSQGIPDPISKELDETVLKPEGTPEFVTRLKDLTKAGGRADIVYIPRHENISDILLLEDVPLESTTGDVGRVEEGGIVGIKPANSGALCADMIQSYITRASTLPKCGYIYGPQPTREDLDVSRAIGSAVICPESCPNVFHWKIALSRFLKDTNYRWQSPAKVRPQLRQQESPQRSNISVVPYGSPVSSSSVARSLSLTSDIRTQLFPAIGE